MPFLLDLYGRYLGDQDAIRFADSVRQFYLQGSLERLASHPAREIRRAAVFTLGLVADYGANPVMGRALCDEDRSVRRLADQGIRLVWTRAGDETQRRRVMLLQQLNVTQRYREVVRKATALVKKAAWFAEGWNQRAIAYFGLERFAESIGDCHQTLEINPYHFPAAAGMGQAYLELGNHVSALEAFRRALRLNPDMEPVRVQVARLARLVEGK
jgi:tetratricopeptide (TPR) repeat protein